MTTKKELGKVVMEIQVNEVSLVTLNVSTFQSGIYLMRAGAVHTVLIIE